MMAGAKAKRKAGPKKGKASKKISTKGFGARAATQSGGGSLLSEPKYDALYAWLNSSPQTVLHKVAIGEFDGLRGVMALQEPSVG